MTEALVEAPFTITHGLLRRAAYIELAAAAPIHRIALPTGKPVWLVTGYREARQVLADPRMIKTEAVRLVIRDLVSAEMFAAWNSHMLNRNPPDHTRLRRLVTPAFSRHRVEQLAVRIQHITDELLDAMADATQVDLIASFALPLPITVIYELLGVPADHRQNFHQWSSTILTGVLAGREELAAAATAMVSYLRDLVAAKRADPTDDLLSALVAQHDGYDRLSEDELTSMAFLILVAGHQPILNLIGNGVLALLTHPEQLTLLRAQPHRLPAAIEELLRFDPPLQMSTSRVTTEPVEIGDVTIPADQVILVGLLATNRDPAHTAQPDALDITRTTNPHLAFGHGIHHCVGAALARLELRIALGSLLARFPGLRLGAPTEQLTWRLSAVLNGLAALPVILR
jgi:cytochrome P450